MRVSGKLTREMRSPEDQLVPIRPHRQLSGLSWLQALRPWTCVQMPFLNEGRAPLQASNTEMQPQAKAAPKRNRWQRGVDPLRQPIPHHRPAEAAAVEAMPTAERKPAPYFDPGSHGGPYEWNLADVAGPNSPDRVLVWGANARYQLPQPPSSAACTPEVDRFLKKKLLRDTERSRREVPRILARGTCSQAAVTGFGVVQVCMSAWIAPSEAPYSDG